MAGYFAHKRMFAAAKTHAIFDMARTRRDASRRQYGNRSDYNMYSYIIW
jgi:hypothetical protein